MNKDRGNLEVFVRLRVHYLRVEELLILGNTRQDAIDITDSEMREGMHNDKIQKMLEESHDDIQKETIDHYLKMIEYAEQQNYMDEPDMNQMDLIIGESWGGNDCSYCKKYHTELANCNKCPLSAGYCCNNLWGDMSRSETWGDWIDNAYKVIEYIKENGGTNE